MSQEQVVFTLNVLRKDYMSMMESLSKIPCDEARKQQAFYRFEEAHMWMQNAIINYAAPAVETERTVQDEVPQDSETPEEHE